MHTLFTYISAIHEQNATVSVVNKSTKTNSYIDDEIEICEAEITYNFDNGVVVQHKTERDNVPSDLVCAECWISYEVIEAAQQKITPLRKTFSNTCQEAFWLKMQG
jgi:hypothetical protein